VDGCCACENPGGLVLELAFEPEATPGVYKLLHLRAHVAIAGCGPEPAVPRPFLATDLLAHVSCVIAGRSRRRRSSTGLPHGAPVNGQG
jgi:hypothetical protein